MIKFMANCQKTTELISRSYEESLSASEKLAVKTHLMICKKCRTFEQNNQLIRQLVRHHRAGKTSITKTASLDQTSAPTKTSKSYD
ncbi:zf-HC2 domain-containing protein [Moraxella canis]